MEEMKEEALHRLEMLEKIYSIQSVHLSVEGVLARKYYCKQLWIELFGSEDVPTWID